jgi:DNA repair protein RadC
VTWSAVLDYLRVAMAFERCVQFRALLPDKRNHLIAHLPRSFAVMYID